MKKLALLIFVHSIDFYNALRYGRVMTQRVINVKYFFSLFFTFFKL